MLTMLVFWVGPGLEWMPGFIAAVVSAAVLGNLIGSGGKVERMPPPDVVMIRGRKIKPLWGCPKLPLSPRPANRPRPQPPATRSSGPG